MKYECQVNGAVIGVFNNIERAKKFAEDYETYFRIKPIIITKKEK